MNTWITPAKQTLQSKTGPIKTKKNIWCDCHSENCNTTILCQSITVTIFLNFIARSLLIPTPRSKVEYILSIFFVRATSQHVGELIVYSSDLLSMFQNIWLPSCSSKWGPVYWEMFMTAVNVVCDILKLPFKTVQKRKMENGSMTQVCVWMLETKRRKVCEQVWMSTSVWTVGFQGAFAFMIVIYLFSLFLKRTPLRSRCERTQF